jgi:hypothetical protein
MNQLFEPYGFSYPMDWLNDSGQFLRRRDSGSEAEIFATTAITLMCTAGSRSICGSLVRCADLIEAATRPLSDSAVSKRRSLVGRRDKNQWLALPENVLNSDCSSNRRGGTHD